LADYVFRFRGVTDWGGCGCDWFQSSTNPSNAALEWQARSLGWFSIALVVVCPLEGFVRSAACQQEIAAGIGFTINA